MVNIKKFILHPFKVVTEVKTKRNEENKKWSKQNIRESKIRGRTFARNISSTEISQKSVSCEYPIGSQPHLQVSKSIMKYNLV